MKSYLFELNVDDLKDSEKILLWSMREWLLCIRLAKDPRKFLIDPMSKCRIQEAVIPLDKIMRTLAYFSSTPIDIRCHCSEQIGSNEIDLLCLLSIKQSQMVFTDRMDLEQQMNTNKACTINILENGLKKKVSLAFILKLLMNNGKMQEIP